MVTVVEEAGTIQLALESYQLARVDDKPAWAISMVDEPPWEGGLQPLLSQPDQTWHLGGLRSTYEPGYTEFGQNTDCRWANRIVPGPKRNELNLAGSITPPNSFFETLGHLFVCAGPVIYKINPGTDVVTVSKDVIPQTTIMGVGWEGNKGYVTTSADNQGIWQVSAIGAPDTWTQSTDVFARILAVGSDRMFKIRNGGELRNVLSGLNPMSVSVWADRVQVGIDSGSSESIVPRSLVPYGRSVVIGKTDGVFGVDDEGKAFNLLKRILKDNATGIGLTLIEPHVWVPHGRGMYRYTPGAAESVGLERELDNASIKGRFLSLASDGNLIYGVLWRGTANKYLMAGREQEGGYGPIAWNTLLELDVSTFPIETPLHVSSLWDPPRLFFPYGNNVAYITLPSKGGGPDIDESSYRFFNTTGGKNRFTGRYNFGTWLDKDFPKVQIVCKGVDVNNYWTVGFSIDGAAYSDNDINGIEMRVNSVGLKTFYLPRTARGREIQYRFTYTLASDAVKIEIVYFEPFAIPISKTIPVIDVVLRLAEDTHFDMGVEGRAAREQLNDLVALAEDSTPVTMNGPWGNFTGHVREVRVQEILQEGVQEPEYLVTAKLQRREEASAYV